MTLNAQEKARFLEALDSDPQFLAEVRQRILTSDLVGMPETFAQFATNVAGFITRQEKFNARQEKFNARQEEFNSKTTETLQRLVNDVGDLKGHVAGRVAREMCDQIAESMGFEIAQVLGGNDLREMVHRNDPRSIDWGARRSFYAADLVARVRDEDGGELYLAAEASYTADGRDTSRAVRNAELLARFTGMRAVPAIVSLNNDHEAQELVDSGTVRWFRLDPRDLMPQ